MISAEWSLFLMPPGEDRRFGHGSPLSLMTRKGVTTGGSGRPANSRIRCGADAKRETHRRRPRRPGPWDVQNRRQASSGAGTRRKTWPLLYLKKESCGVPPGNATAQKPAIPRRFEKEGRCVHRVVRDAEAVEKGQKKRDGGGRRGHVRLGGRCKVLRGV